MKLLLQLSLLAVSAAALAAAPEKLGFDPATAPDRAADAYIAAENSFLFRMRYPDGTYREFERDFAHPTVLRSGQGWRGAITGDRIVISTGENVEGGPARWTFKTGRLVSFVQGETRLAFAYDAPRGKAGETPPYYFAEEGGATVSGPGGKKSTSRDQAVRLMAGHWKKSGRLAWPFINPNENGCLYAALAMLSVFLLFAKRTALRCAGAAAFLAAVVALAATASRGAMLALAVGLAPVVLLKAKVLVKSKAAWIFAGVVLLAAVAWFATHDTRIFTRGFSGASSWSNEVRLEMWKAVPQMAVEAPGGWGFAHVGRAFLDWYQELGELAMPGSLMNEHLTRIAALGWTGRYFYAFAWLAGLALLGVAAWKTRNAVAFGMWTLFAIAGWFNPVFDNRVLWIAPVASLVVFAALGHWRAWRRPVPALATVAAAAVLAGALMGVVRHLGSGKPARGYPVFVTERQVRVKTPSPVVWIVDDGNALGGVMACKDIRGYYVYNPSAPGVGYVRRVEDLPKTGVRKLVLAGTAGDDWMRKMSEGGAEAQKNIPAEVLFVSPPFPPSALPEGFRKACSVRIAVGEFAARYESEYDDPPPWVTVAPGMELYLNGWMELAVGS